MDEDVITDIKKVTAAMVFKLMFNTLSSHPNVLIIYNKVLIPLKPLCNEIL